MLRIFPLKVIIIISFVFNRDDSNKMVMDSVTAVCRMKCLINFIRRVNVKAAKFFQTVFGIVNRSREYYGRRIFNNIAVICAWAFVFGRWITLSKLRFIVDEFSVGDSRNACEIYGYNLKMTVLASKVT